MERYRTTLILLGALVVLIVGWLLLRNSNIATSSSATPTVTPVTYVWQETGDVSSIDVMSGTQTVSVRQDLSTTVWSVTAPISDTADTSQVGTAADSLKALVATAVLTDASDLAQYGLDKPVMTVKMATGGSTPANHSFVTGKTTIDSSGYYIKADSDKNVYVIANTLVEQLKSWLTTPPKAVPTATPLPAETPTPVAATTITATGTITLTVPVSPTTSLSGSATITSTSPGAANPTTPEASPTK